MSALLAHAKAYRALGKRLGITANHRPIKAPENKELLLLLGRSLEKAAEDIEELARAECSGDDRPPAHQPKRKAR